MFLPYVLSRKTAVALGCICMLVGAGSTRLQAKPKHQQNSVIYQYPLRIPPEISGSFAELRSTHFHGGMDFRTRQREGLRVFSAAPGRIVRAGVSRVSYGKVLYVQHRDSSISVYAHLSKFCPRVQKLVRKQQKHSGKYETDLRHLNIKTRKCIPIARSGNTGSSGGPHLHFEIIRDTFRLNPAGLGLSVEDSAAPNLLYFALYTRTAPSTSVLPDLPALNPDSALQRAFMDAPKLDLRMARILQAEYDSVLRLIAAATDTLPCRKPPLLGAVHRISDTFQWNARYYKAHDLPDTLFLNGVSAFGICALDSIRHMPFHYGLYRLGFFVESADGTRDTIACYELDRLSFETCKAINRHIDLPFYRLTGKRLEKSWLEPGQTHTPYRLVNNRGIFTPRPGSHYTLIINTEDIAGNQSGIRIPLVCKSLAENHASVAKER